MQLTGENVQNILLDCLFKEGEDQTNQIKAEGVHLKIGFHPQRLENNRENVKLLLNQLPVEFKQGWSFLEACNDNKGNLWTGLHSTIDELFVLGLALDLIIFCMPRELWSMLPGGLPYFIVRE